MAKVVELPEQKVILEGISWETYERLLADHGVRRVPRLAYDRGVLEVMSPSTEHEMVARIIEVVVTVVSEEMGVDVVSVGSTTFRRADLQRGFEPDACFYVQNAKPIRGRRKIDLMVDPPPDIVFEMDLTSPSLNKLPIYAGIGVPEVWRHNGERLFILRLEGEEYVEVLASRVLPPLTAEALSRFIEERWTLGRPALMRKVREWVRRQIARVADAPTA